MDAVELSHTWLSLIQWLVLELEDGLLGSEVVVDEIEISSSSLCLISLDGISTHCVCIGLRGTLLMWVSLITQQL